MTEIQDFPMALGTQQTTGKMESSPSIFKLIAAGGKVLKASAFKLVVEDLQDDNNKYAL